MWVTEFCLKIRRASESHHTLNNFIFVHTSVRLLDEIQGKVMKFCFSLEFIRHKNLHSPQCFSYYMFVPYIPLSTEIDDENWEMEFR